MTEPQDYSPEVAPWPATEVFYKNLNAQKQTILNVGGARSSKSYSIIQLFAAKFFSETNKKFLTTRKTFPALAITAYKDAVDRLIERGLYRGVIHNKSRHTLEFPPLNNYWLFASFDQPDKIKSTEFNYIHMEEGNEFSYEDYRILKLRLSGPAGPLERNQLFITLNPSDDQGWVHQTLMQTESIELIKSTYQDNPFLSREYITELEQLRQQDDTYWRIYGLGEWATVRDLIFGPLEVIDQLPDYPDKFYGLDFGYNNATALIGIAADEWTVAFRELIHNRFMTNADLIKRMEAEILPGERRRPIYADPSEPARIEEIHRAGFNIQQADKDVLAGILFLKRFRRLTLASNINLNREFKSYKWRTDRLGKVLDEPVKFEDHGPDAARYGVWTHLKKRGVKSYYIGFSKHDAY